MARKAFSHCVSSRGKSNGGERNGVSKVRSSVTASKRRLSGAYAIGNCASGTMIVHPRLWACVGSVDTRILGTTILGKGFTMARTHLPYPPAFRAEAVELARTSGKGIPQLAQYLGISEQALRGWLKRADIDAGRGQGGDLTTIEREELRRLRRENQVLKQEREILKKAAAYCARETLCAAIGSSARSGPAIR